MPSTALARSGAFFPSQPTSFRPWSWAPAEKEPRSKNENKSLHSSPVLFIYTPCLPLPPATTETHRALEPSSQNESGPLRGVQLGHRNFPSCQARALPHTDLRPTSLAHRARAASPAGGVEPPVSQPRQPWKCLLSRALLTPNTLQSLLPKGSPCRCLGMELGARTAQAAEVDPVPASPCPAVHSTLSFQRSNRNRSFSPGLRPQGILRGYQEASCKPPSFSSCM